MQRRRWPEGAGEGGRGGATCAAVCPPAAAPPEGGAGGAGGPPSPGRCASCSKPGASQDDSTLRLVSECAGTAWHRWRHALAAAPRAAHLDMRRSNGTSSKPSPSPSAAWAPRGKGVPALASKGENTTPEPRAVPNRPAIGAVMRKAIGDRRRLTVKTKLEKNWSAHSSLSFTAHSTSHFAACVAK